MDEFNDLDRELEKLKAELSLTDEWTRQFSSPAPGDYWKHRMDEEKALWQKKLEVNEQEKKAMEARMNSQQSEIGAYNQKLAEIEKKFDVESKNWEERLKAKEAELLMEKNRLLWEDKVREVEFENRNHLKAIADLNGELSKLKDAHAAEIKKLEEEFGRERGAYHERIKTGVESTQLLQERILELEGRLHQRSTELEGEIAKVSGQALIAEDNGKKSAAESENLKKEKQQLEAEVARVKQKGLEERNHAEHMFKEMSKGFVDSWRKSLGSVIGMVRFIQDHRTTRPVWNVFSELLKKAEDETELLAAQAGIASGTQDKYSAVLLASDDDTAVWSKILSGAAAELHCINKKTWKKDIEEVKPRILITSVKDLGLARRAHKRWPFIPVVVFGDLKPGLKKRALACGFSVISAPATDAETFNTLDSAALRSVSYPEYWDRIKVKPSYGSGIAAVLILLTVAAGAYVYKVKPPIIFAPAKTVAFVTPYLEPTNVTYDGQNLWACDWYGQSIYKHKINGELGISRIFYFQNKHFSALAWMAGNLWSADAMEQKIYKHNTDDSLTVTAAFNSPGPSPSGLAGNGRFLWSCDAATARIYKHNLDKELTVAAEYQAPGANPSGLFYDGTYLWSTDSKTNRIYCHKTDEDLTVIGTYMPPGYEQKGFNLSGITGNGKVFWVCSEKAGKIYQYPANLFAKSK